MGRANRRCLRHRAHLGPLSEQRGKWLTRKPTTSWQSARGSQCWPEASACSGRMPGPPSRRSRRCLRLCWSRVLHSLSRHRSAHVAETLEDAAEAAGDPVELLVEKAVADERREELLARTLTIAEDTALRDKRRALGRALAAVIAGDDAKIDEELLFVRAVADIDTPHIRLLAGMAEVILPGKESGSIFHCGWSLAAIAARDLGLGEAAPAILSTLESHAGWSARRGARRPGRGRFERTKSLPQEETLLERLAAESRFAVGDRTQPCVS